MGYSTVYETKSRRLQHESTAQTAGMGDGFSMGQHFDPIIGSGGGNDLSRGKKTAAEMIRCLAIEGGKIAAHPQLIAADHQRADFEIGIDPPGCWCAGHGVNQGKSCMSGFADGGKATADGDVAFIDGEREYGAVGGAKPW